MRRAALLLLLALGACKAGPRGPVLVRVNGEAVTLPQLQQEKALLGPGNKMDDDDLLEDLIDQALILQAARHEGIHLDEAAQEAAEKQALAGTDPTLLAAELQQRGLTLGDWRRRIRRAAQVDECVRRMVRNRLDLSHQEVQDHYWEHLPEYRSGQRWVLRQVFTRRKSSAEKALRELDLGEAFPAVAQRRGEGPEAAQGGLLGARSAGQLPHALAKAAGSLKPGHYSKLIGSPWGWHILYLESRLPPRSLSLDEAAPEIRVELLKEKEQIAYQAWLARLREQAQIQRLPAPAPVSSTGAERP